MSDVKLAADLNITRAMAELRRLENAVKAFGALRVPAVNLSVSYLGPRPAELNSLKNALKAFSSFRNTTIKLDIQQTGATVKTLRDAASALKVLKSTSITINLTVNYRGPSVTVLRELNKALRDLARAPRINLDLGLGNVAAFAGAAYGINQITQSLYGLALASDQARISGIGFDRQVAKTGSTSTEASQGVRDITESVKISETEAKGLLATMIRSGASIKQAVLFAKAGAFSALLAGRTAAQGVEAINDSLQTGLSNKLNTIGIAQNISTYLDKVRREVGKKQGEELSGRERARAMELLVIDAVVKTGELDMGKTLLGGVSGEASELTSTWKGLREELGKTLVVPTLKVINTLQTGLEYLKTNGGEIASVFTGLAAGAGIFGATLAAVNLPALIAGLTLVSPPLLAIAAAMAIAGGATIKYIRDVNAEANSSVPDTFRGVRLGRH